MFPGNSNSVLGIEKRRLSNTCSNRHSSNSTCIINNSNIQSQCRGTIVHVLYYVKMLYSFWQSCYIHCVYYTNKLF